MPPRELVILFWLAAMGLALPDPAKAQLIEELIVALKAEQNQQQVMQMVQNAMLNQINQIMDSQLKTLGDDGAADAEKRARVQADLEDFPTPNVRSHERSHVVANHEAGLRGHVR